MRRNEVTVGLVLVLGTLLIVFGTLWLKSAKLGSEQRTIEARFREAGQLMEGNAVKVRGVPIGEVENIMLEPDGEAVRITMRIDGDVKLPRDAVVILSPESLFGDWQAEIFSSTQFPRYAYMPGRGRNVLPGYALPDISRLTAVADRIAENLAVLTDRIEVAFTEETAVNIREMIENLQQVSQQLTSMVEAQENTVEEVAGNLQSATQSMGAAAESVRRTFARLDVAMEEGQVESIVENARLASEKLDSLTTALTLASQDLRSAVQTADSVFTPLVAVTQGIARGEGTLGRLAQDTALYAELVRTNQQVQILLKDIQANPRKYINLKVF